MFANGVLNGLLNPFIPNHSPVLPGSSELEVERGFHAGDLTERGRATETLVLKHFDLHVTPCASG